MKNLRKYLYIALGLRSYLRFVSASYLLLIRNGFLKQSSAELHFLNKLLKPGFRCLDIGANLGYYSASMLRIVGETGTVHAVEPVPILGEIWKKNLNFEKQRNLFFFPYALGEKEAKVKMGMPKINGILHHGMTKVFINSNENYEKEYTVEMKIPKNLFCNIGKIDFIKIDVEGYEYHVLSNMTAVLQKNTPIIQAELGGKENRKKTVELLQSLGYDVHHLQNNALVPTALTGMELHAGDFYFLQKNR